MKNKVIKKCVICLLVFAIIYSSAFLTFSHSVSLNVDYEKCKILFAEDGGLILEDGIDELWYCFIGEGTEHNYHIDHNVIELKYYFSTNDSSVDDLNLSEEVIEEIKTAFVNSMKKWNDIYYYSYDSNGNRIKNKIINIIEGTQSSHNVNIKLYGNLPWILVLYRNPKISTLILPIVCTITIISGQLK